MKRLAALTAALAFLPIATFAQNENVIVNKDEPLSGLWRISFPRMEVSLGFGGIRFLGSNSFCRISEPDKDGEYTIQCLSAFGSGKGTGTLEGKKLHLAWGISIARIVLDTTMEAPRAFAGTFGVKLFGIKYDAEEQSSASKFILSADTADRAGKAGLLSQALAQLASGEITLPKDPALFTNIGGARANSTAEIQGLGKLEALLYLGEVACGALRTGNKSSPLSTASIRSNSPTANACAAFISATMACWMDFSVFNPAGDTCSCHRILATATNGY
jgi:hypothetical protein